MTPDARQIDRAIDVVAGHLIAGDAPPDLRARVLARLDTRRPAIGIGAWKPAYAIVAVALVATAAAWLPHQFATPARTAPSTTLTSVVASPATAVAPTPEVETPANTQTARRPKGPSETEVAWSERAVAALPVVEPLTIDAIQPEPIAIPQLEVKPLALPDAGSDGKGRQ